jgi:hypothetical protein
MSDQRTVEIKVRNMNKWIAQYGMELKLHKWKNGDGSDQVELKLEKRLGAGDVGVDHIYGGDWYEVWIAMIGLEHGWELASNRDEFKRRNRE